MHQAHSASGSVAVNRILPLSKRGVVRTFRDPKLCLPLGSFPSSKLLPRVTSKLLSLRNPTQANRHHTAPNNSHESFTNFPTPEFHKKLNTQSTINSPTHRSLLSPRFRNIRKDIMADRPHRGGGGGGGNRGNYRGRGGGDRGGRGGRGGDHHHGGKNNDQQGERERPKKENILDLAKYMDKEVQVKFNGGREGKKPLP